MTVSIKSLPLPAGLCVIGMGLIGGSLMRAARRAAPDMSVYGWSPDETERIAATTDGFQVAASLEAALTRAAAEDHLLVLASPVTTFEELLAQIDEHAPMALVTDVGGVKGPVAELVAATAPHIRYVGSHPMAGTEHSGWQAGRADLFDDAMWVTTIDDDTELGDWLPVAALALAIGARVVPCEPEAHDGAVARISHLPHLLAAALAQVGHQGGPLALTLAAGSFRDGTRVAGTRPELVRAMCETNGAALLEALDDALGLIGVARGSLASSGSLAKIAAAGYASRQAYDHRFSLFEDMTLTGDDMVDQLLAVGAAGGYVINMTDTSATPSVTVRYPVDE